MSLTRVGVHWLSASALTLLAAATSGNNLLYLLFAFLVASFALSTNDLVASVDASGKYLYVAHYSNVVSAYAINLTTGALSPLAGSPFPAGNTPHGATAAITRPANLSMVEASISPTDATLITSGTGRALQLGVRDLVDHAAVLHHVVAVGNGRGEAEVLLDEQNGEATSLELRNRGPDLLDDNGRQPLGGFVQQ